MADTVREIIANALEDIAVRWANQPATADGNRHGKRHFEYLVTSREIGGIGRRGDLDLGNRFSRFRRNCAYYLHRDARRVSGSGIRKGCAAARRQPRHARAQCDHRKPDAAQRGRHKRRASRHALAAAPARELAVPAFRSGRTLGKPHPENLRRRRWSTCTAERGEGKGAFPVVGDGAECLRCRLHRRDAGSSSTSASTTSRLEKGSIALKTDWNATLIGALQGQYQARFAADLNADRHLCAAQALTLDLRKPRYSARLTTPTSPTFRTSLL